MKVVLGVGGGIAAYKAAELARALQQRGCTVETVMTSAAQRFITREEFIERRDRNEFLEWAPVFENFYGTHASYIDIAAADDRDLVLDIDVQGARQLKERIPDSVSIFILPPSRVILEERLRARGEDSEAVIERRLREAEEEIRHYDQYDYVLINDDLESATAKLRAIFVAERLKRGRVERKIAPILEGFVRTGRATT